MLIVISEFSSGFSNSTFPLCNALIKQSPKDKFIYLCSTGNPYINNLDKAIVTYPIFDTFGEGDQYRKGTWRWLYDRITKALINAYKRQKFIKNNKPDIVLIVGNNMSVIDQFFLKYIKKYSKLVDLVHDVLLGNISLGWSKSSLKRSYHIADGLVVHSEENKQDLINLFNIPEKKIMVTHLGINVKYRKLKKEDCQKRLGCNSQKPVLLFYGSIRQQKGLDVLIKALNGIDCQLIIAGAMPYGESFDKYQALIKANHIQCIKFIKFTSEEFRDVLFQAADFIVLPYKEFFSQSGPFLQAIQYEKPIIATDVSAFRSYVEKYKLGYICSPNDEEDLHKTIQVALDEMITGCWNDMPGVRTAIQENSWESSADNYLKFFHRLLESN